MKEKNYLRIFKFVNPYWKEIGLTLCIVLIFATSNVYFIPLVKDISKEIGRKHITYFSLQMLNAFILWNIRVIAQFGQNYLMARISYKIMIDIQETVYNKLHSFSQHFYSRWKLGELLVRTFTDSSKVQETIQVTFSLIIPQLITLIAVLIYLLTINWKLTLFALISVPIFVLSMGYFTELIKRRTAQIQKKISSITHIVQETLVNMKLIQAYTMESTTKKRFFRENRKNLKYTMSSIKLNETKKAIELGLQGIVFISIIFFGGRLVANESITGPELLSFFTGCALLIDPVIVLSKGYTQIQQSLVSANRIFEILDTNTKIITKSNAIKKTIEGKISIENISFHYENNENNKNKIKVLDDVSIDAPKGSVTAIVGLSGAGKTTLINLIPRFYDVTQGVIKIDDNDIKNYDLINLRNQIGIVLQDDILFSGTILENIRFGSPKSKIEDVIKAAKLANAWEFISKCENKLYTKVGDKGMRLSGGQKQRISIARAILRDPRILILDEATSALDSESENLVKEALIHLMKNRTTFVIAHRLSTIKHADNIVVLDKGKIVEHGSHHELLEKNGHYKNLYKLQFR